MRQQRHSIPLAHSERRPSPIRWRRVLPLGVAGGFLSALLLIGAASAYPPPTGSARSGWFSGWLQKCGTSACVTWFGSANGESSWIATLVYEDLQYRYVIRPYEQGTLLFQGKMAWRVGIFPQATWSTDVFDRAGNRIIKGFRTSGGPCWDALLDQTDLFAAGCSTGGFSIPTRQYPPGSIRANFWWFDPGAVGMIGGSYRGDLR